jgi:hypothetical protein
MRQAFTRAACALILLGSTCVGLPALGQQPSPLPQSRSTITVPLQELPAGDTLGERAERLWTGISRLFSVTPNREQMLRSIASAERRQAHARDDFSWLMNIAGFKLKEIESSFSLLPGLSFTFGHARELTEADRDYVEQQLERHAGRNPGPLPMMPVDFALTPQAKQPQSQLYYSGGLAGSTPGSQRAAHIVAVAASPGSASGSSTRGRSATAGAWYRVP